MTPGTILFHQNFTFSDGTKGKKLLVLLTDLAEGYFYVVAKTTSRDKGKGRNPGCQQGDFYPNFFIPQKTTRFDKDTWIDLNEFFEFKHTEFLQRHFSGEIETKGTLDDALVKQLLACALQSEDITVHQAKAIQATVAKF